MGQSLTGADTIVIDGRILNFLADGESVKLDPQNDLAVVKVGKNGNAIYAFNNMGVMVDVTIRVLLGSPDDAYLNGRLQEMKSDFSSFILLSGSFAKRVGDGQGNVQTKVFQLSGGIIKRIPAAKTSAEGDTDQSVAEYMVTFAANDPSIQ